MRSPSPSTINRFPGFYTRVIKALFCLYLNLNSFITFSGRLILSDFLLNFQYVSSSRFPPSNVEGNFEFCYQLFWWWRRVWNLQDSTRFMESSFPLVDFSPLLLHKVLLKVIWNSKISAWWKLWRNLKPRPVWRLAGRTQGLEVGGWRVGGGNDRRCSACAQPFKGRLSARKFGKIPATVNVHRKIRMNKKCTLSAHFQKTTLCEKLQETGPLPRWNFRINQCWPLLTCKYLNETGTTRKL